METKQVIALTCSRLQRKPGNAMMNTKSLKQPEESWRNAGDYPLHLLTLGIYSHALKKWEAILDLGCPSFWLFVGNSIILSIIIPFLLNILRTN